MEYSSADIGLGYEGEICVELDTDEWEEQYRYLMRLIPKHKINLLLEKIREQYGN